MTQKRGDVAVRPHGAQGYRADIDGLRSIAVLSVVLFHLDKAFLPGGFAGVDVFFVISGFLITGIVNREIEGGRFSIVAFYERRIRRIFPALIAVVLSVMTIGAIVLMPDELRELGATAVAATLSASNFLFWWQTDYFAGAAEHKPLLHTWSLAVEEQFYIILPPLLMLSHRFAKAHVKLILAGLTVISFALSCVWTVIDASGNYYLPHTRAWELLIGSLLALGIVPGIRSRLGNELVAAAGLLLMLSPFVLLNGDMAFPAWNALSTCLGTAALIHSGGETRVGRLLSLKPMVGLGLISFSVYLVHWPLIVFTKYTLLREPTLAESVGLLAVILVLGWASWRFVEQPFRSKDRVPRIRLFQGAFAAVALICLAGAASFLTNGFPQRFGANLQVAAAPTKRSDSADSCFMQGGWQTWPGAKCFLLEGSGAPTLLWGDSHANQYVGALRKNGQKLDKPILLFASAGCPPVLGVEVPLRKHCAENNRQVLRIIREYGVDRVVMSSYWERVLDANDIDLSAVTRTVRTLKDEGLEVAIIGANPDFPFANPKYLAMRLERRGFDGNFYTGVRNSIDFNVQLHAAAGDVAFYDPMKTLCLGDECLAYTSDNLVMSDNAHLSLFGAELILKEIRPFFMANPVFAEFTSDSGRRAVARVSGPAALQVQ